MTSNTVRIWKQPLTLPTYTPGAPDPNPMFFENRNIQGAKGNIYPNPFTDQLASQKEDHTYEAVFLENEYLQMIMLPEIGGRVFAGKDKTNGYDFFYRHKVIKPALIGVFGPWISGGIEFNWPQHHRPTTFMATDVTLEEHPDGSKTCWMSEHDPLNRTKGMVGICLYPGKAFVETKVRLYNRTPIAQSFLWWENVGVHINPQYQVIFPPDVHWMVYHTKADVNSYPIAKGVYYNTDYATGTDVSWYVNSPRPASFFAGDSRYEFFGGYDHAAKAGVVHVANRHISPGKKYFTWANGPFGHQWQRNLYDFEEEGEYLELMAGVYTDNQPDFSWIMPYETKTFSQFWLPVQAIGGMKNANTRAALNLEFKDGQAQVGVYAAEELPGARIILSCAGKMIWDARADLAPGKPFTAHTPVGQDAAETTYELRLLSASGEEVIRYQPDEPWDGTMPKPFEPPAAPKDIASSEKLYLAGLHLEQYRHTRIAPEPYWEEALRRDDGDSRAHVALGRSCFRHGDFEKAEEHFQAAVKRLTWLNFNPYDGEAHYNLGLTRFYRGKIDAAYDALYKATWTYPWQAAGFYAIAQIDCQRGDYLKALEHLERSLAVNTENLKARNLKSAILRQLGRAKQAAKFTAETIAIDPLDSWSRFEKALATTKTSLRREYLDEAWKLMRGDVQTALDLAFDYAHAGFFADAAAVLTPTTVTGTLYPMAAYTLGYLAQKAGNERKARQWYRLAATASPDYCFPWRLEEMIVLRQALTTFPKDARASYYLGNLLYDKKHYHEAVTWWENAVKNEPEFAIPWRNLGLAAYNLDKDIEKAHECCEKAFQANPNDPRILYELDQLERRRAAPPQERLARLEQHRAVVEQRDNLMMELIVLTNRTGQAEKALEIATKRHYHPWEGGEGSIAGQYATAYWLLGRQALDKGDLEAASKAFETGLKFPESLGEVPYDAEVAAVIYYAGLVQARLGNQAAMHAHFKRLLAIGDLGSATSYYQALAMRQMGKAEEAKQKLEELRTKAAEMSEKTPEQGYFHYGAPSPVFEDDELRLNRIHFGFVHALAELGLGNTSAARAALENVLALDPAHLPAYEEWLRIK